MRSEKREGGCVSLCCVYSFVSKMGGQQAGQFDLNQNIPVPFLTLSSPNYGKCKEQVVAIHMAHLNDTGQNDVKYNMHSGVMSSTM